MAAYVNNHDLYYQTIISLGKGYKTDELNQYFYLIAIGVSSKFVALSNVKNDWNISADQLQEAYLALGERWKTVNVDKYPNVFQFYSEIAKRACAQSYNQIVFNVKGSNTKKSFKTFSISDAINLY